ncbi:MAG: efflux RND transporter periplasmic adaptor subunit [Betaproteobacteria bacterium]|nr:MAG: efflux RND transporter periplasmic adaptor subunit [Betaproteobacteria bacterium]
MKSNRAWAGVLSALLFAGCGERAADAPVRAARAPVLKTATVELREVDLTYTADAVMEAVRQSTVAAQIAGRVVDIRFDVGDYVKRGEVIVRIDERVAAQAVAASEAQVSEAVATANNARASLERSKALFAQRFISQAALDKAEADYKAAQARVSALLAGAGQAATQRGFATIVAPYSGIVSARHVELGEMATPGKPLMTGFDPSTLRAVATVPQARVAAIQAGVRARIEVPAVNRWFDVKSVVVVPSADPRTHTTRVRLELPADTRDVYPGVFARAHFTVGKATRLLVAREAILRRSEVTAVYVVDGQGVPRLRQVRLGEAADDRWVEVLAGLRPGETVALDPVVAGMTSPAAANTAPQSER